MRVYPCPQAFFTHLFVSLSFYEVSAIDDETRPAFALLNSMIFIPIEELGIFILFTSFFFLPILNQLEPQLFEVTFKSILRTKLKQDTTFHEKETLKYSSSLDSYPSLIS